VCSPYHVRRALFPLLLLALAACGDAPSFEAGRVSSAIINGRPSGEDENAAVYIETVSPDDPNSRLRCSGRIIAPGLAVTARHCLLKRRSENVLCNPDGTPADPTQESNIELEPPEAITIFIGAQKSTARSVSVQKIITELDVSICRSDIAYLALTEAGLDARTPIRREPPQLLDPVSVTGWGYTSDSQRTSLPDTRSTIEKTVTYTTGGGSNGLPPDAFAIGGNSLCLGDSGASGLRQGALLGVYSRLDDPTACELDANRNVFVWVGAHLPLAESAFKAIGETPWYEGERPPWLAKPGAACAKDEECMSSRCDSASSTCVAPCGEAGLACPAGKTCSAEQTCVAPVETPPAPPPEEEDGGCTTTRSAKTSPIFALLVGLFVAAAIGKRRRSRH
jgi:hypothetical protein